MVKKQNIKIKQSKNIKIKKKSKKSLYQTYINNYKKIVQETILYIQVYKNLDIMSASELNTYIQSLERIFIELDNLQILLDQKSDKITIENNLNKIKQELSINFKSFGTKNIDDLLKIVFDDEYIDNLENDNSLHDIYNIMKKYVHPINYKVLSFKNIPKNQNKKIIKNKIVEDFMICEQSKTFDCFDLARTTKNFQTKVYGIKICFQNHKKKKP